MLHRTTWAFASVLILIVAVACGGGSSEAPVAPAVPAADPIDPATAGSVMGTITFGGSADGTVSVHDESLVEEIRMNSDPFCAMEATSTQTEYYVVGDDGGLGNVFIYVKEGLEGRAFPPVTETVVLDQNGCRYSPHVFGIRVGQTLQVLNSDQTLHNIHATPSANTEFNTGQPIEGMIYDTSFDTPEVMVPFKCDVHGWMNAYVGVVDHPYFVVTGNDGKFDISNLPPGDYVVEAWHETMGVQTQDVTVGEGATAELNFTYTIG
jgi:plastocyanin